MVREVNRTVVRRRNRRGSDIRVKVRVSMSSNKIKRMNATEG